MAASEGGVVTHAQTAIQVILVAVIIWAGSSIISLRDSTIRSEEKYGQLKESIAELKLEIAALRTVINAGADRDTNTNQTIRDMLARIENNTKRLERLEGRR